MTELELLFLILALIYAWECACWVPRGSVAFRTWFGERWSIRHPSILLGNQRGGFVFGQPLPPLGTVFLCNQLPLSLSPEGFLAFVASIVNPGWRPPQTGRFGRFADSPAVQADGKKLRVNGVTFLKTGSANFTRFLAAKLTELGKMHQSARQAAIGKLSRQLLDTSAVEARLNEFRQLPSGLRRAPNSLFVLLFLIAPVAIWQFGLGRCWLPLLLGILACTTTTALLFHRAHKRLYPEAEDERFTHFLVVLLSPASAMRVRDMLSRPLLENFHPLAAAKVLCSGPEFRDYARDVLRELRHPAMPLCPDSGVGAPGAELHWREALRTQVERLLLSGGLNPESLLEKPKPNDPTCRAWCPRCGAQYTSPAGTCEDCGGLPLVKLNETPSEAK